MIRQPAIILLGLALTAGALHPAVDTAGATAAPSPRGPYRDEIRVIGLPENHWVFTVDWQAMAVASLAEDRANHAAAERAEFDDLMFQLLDQAYRRLLNNLAGREIEMTAEENRPEGLIQRKFIARALKSRDDTMEFYFLLKRDDGEWSLQDFATDGVSIVRVYRSQFRKILKNEGFAVLVQKMRAKVDRDRAAVP